MLEAQEKAPQTKETESTGRISGEEIAEPSKPKRRRRSKALVKDASVTATKIEAVRQKKSALEPIASELETSQN